MTRGMLVGVSVGPGDPELMTYKAVRAIRDADVVCVPDSGAGELTRAIAAAPIEGKRTIACEIPMGRDCTEAYECIAHAIERELSSGLTVAYLCLGDVSTYSTFGPIRELVAAHGYEVRAIPGVTSFCAAAARTNMMLCQGTQRLLVCGASDVDDEDDPLAFDATKAVLKVGRHLPALTERLTQLGLVGEACAVERLGLEGERITWGLRESAAADYLTVVLVPSPRMRT